MIAVEPETESLDDFAANPQRLLRKLQESGQPVRLDVGGQSAVVLIREPDFDRLVQTVEELELLASVREGLEDAAAGRGKPFAEFMAEVAQRYKFATTPSAP